MAARVLPSGDFGDSKADEGEKDDCRHGNNVCIRARATDAGSVAAWFVRSPALIEPSPSHSH